MFLFRRVEAEPRRGESNQKIEIGKAEPFRTSGGGAARNPKEPSGATSGQHPDDKKMSVDATAGCN